MKKPTQRDRVRRHLIEHGSLTNVEAFHMQILRLSERIRELQEEGLQIEGDWVRDGGKKTGTYRYVLLSRPKQTKTVYDEVVVDGVRMRRPRVIEVL